MDRQINLMDVLKLYLKRWWIIVIAMVVCAVFSGIYTTTFVTPKYTSYGTLYTENTSDIMNQDVTGVNYDTVMVRKELAGTYAEILSSNTFMEKVAKQSDLGYSATDISRMVSMSVKDDTEIVIVSVTSVDPKHSHIIAQKALDMAPEFISEIIDGGSVKLLDQPVYSEIPSSPNVVRNIEIGAILGILLSMALVLVVEIIDNKVKDADTLTAIFKYPILGEIPTVQHQKRKNNEGAKQIKA